MYCVYPLFSTVCILYLTQVNARVYYEEECTRLQEELKIEREEVNKKRLPLLFVTMASHLEAAGYVRTILSTVNA